MTAPPTAPWHRIRPHLVGLFAALHIGAVALGSFRTIELGDLVVTEPIEQAWASAAQHTETTRRTYGEWLGAKQVWAMFSGVRSHTGRTEVWISEQGQWRPIYIERSSEFTWRRTTFDHYRWREAMLLSVQPRRRMVWRRMTDWLVEEALEDFPNAEGVRIKRQRAKMLTAQQLNRGQRRQYTQRILVRGRMR